MNAQKSRRNSKPAKAPVVAIDRAAALVDFGAGIWPSRFAKLAPLVIALAALLVYSNSFRVPFIYDDADSIVDNPSIRQLAPWSGVLNPPGAGTTVSGRPLLNFSFAVNYAQGGLDVRGYHVFNIAIHILAGLALFGFVRRTLLRPPLREQCASNCTPLAFAVALIWTLHPLQTESVTYIVQRAESLGGLFYLLTLYCFARSLDAPAPRRWLALSACACLLGVFTKEGIVTAPLVVLLYDRTFGAGTFRDAISRRRAFYATLCATWIPLGFLLAMTGGRGGTAGFSSGLSSWSYAKIQSWAVIHYLELVFWPRDLVFDYGLGAQLPLSAVAGRACAVLALLCAAALALWKRPAPGFAAASIFIMLAPTSSFVPISTETVAEHRMYLPLAAMIALVIIPMGRLPMRILVPACLLIASAAGWWTFERNKNYASAVSIWSDTVYKRRNDFRNRTNLGLAMVEAGMFDQALQQYEEALKFAPEHPIIEMDVGMALLKSGRPAEAIAHFETSLRKMPLNPTAESGIALSYMDMGKPEMARPHCLAFLKIQPGNADALAMLAKIDAAIAKENAKP